MEFRNNQLECINKIENHFENENKALIKMFCGSGKSFIIYDSLIKYGNNLSVVVVPSINLITQFNKDYLLNDFKYDKKYEILTICSKNELDKKTFTTNEKDILEFLEKDTDNLKIILITYQSLKLFINIINENEFDIDIMCFDEAHHILGDETKNLLFGTDEEYDDFYPSFIDNYVNKTLFFTATPKNSNDIMMYEPINHITINNEDFEFIDDNSCIYEEPHCGKMIYEYMHIDGVNDNILNDFKIRVDLYTENTDKSIFETICRSILETGNNRVLTFHSRSETISEKGSDVLTFVNKKNQQELKKCFDKILKEFPHLSNKYSKINFKGMTANTKNKNNILNEFDGTPDNEIFILASCKTIGEGIDTKNANMVVFVDPKQSYVEIIQNIGRICRKNENTKDLATVLIPCYVDVNKYKNCKNNEEKDKVIRDEMSKTGDFNGILNVLSALRQEDPYIFELCVNNPETYTIKEIRNNFKRNGLELEDKEYELEDFELLSHLEKKNIIITNTKISEKDEIIDNGYDEMIYIVKTGDKYMKVKESVKKMVSRPNRNIKPSCYMNDEIKILWSFEKIDSCENNIFGGFIKSTIIVDNEEVWNEKLEQVKKYIDENKKRPSKHDKNIDVKKLGYWLSNSIQNYKKEIQIMKNKKIYNIFTKFFNEYIEYFKSYEELWNNNLEQLKKYIDENNKRPSDNDKEYNIKKLGSWLSHQTNNYKNKKEIMKNKDIYDKWTKFIDEYKEYFKSNEEHWNNNLQQLKKYIDNNNKRPSQEDKNKEIKQLANWVNCQQQNYNKKEHIMINIEIYNKWTEFIDKYKEYFKSNEEIWLNNLQKLKKYIDNNNKKPSSSHKNTDIKSLGLWIGTQQKNYKKKEGIMKNEEIYIKWTKFIDEYKIYLQSNEEIWLNNLEKVKKYIYENNKRPSQIDRDKEAKILGKFISHQITNYKKREDIMKNDDIYNIWTEFINNENFKQYFITNDELWYDKLEEVIKYIDENKYKPSTTDKNKDIKQLGHWISVQQQNYKKKENIMINEEIYHKWNIFINDEKYKIYFQSNEEIWLNNYGEVKKYIDNNNKRPSSEDKNKEIKFLGIWLLTQTKNYTKKEQIMKNEEIYNIWTEFINDKKYKTYFISNEELWLDNLNEVEKYIIQNNKKPSRNDKNKEIKRLASFINTQSQNYKKNEQIMKDENIRNLWKDFTNKYNKYFQTNDNNDEITICQETIFDSNQTITISEPSISLVKNRPEQSKLRKYLIDNKENKCIICRITKPVKLLECAHLLPHCKIDNETKCDLNIVEFMCLDCHKLYDCGEIGVYNGKLQIKDIDEYPQYTDLENINIECYNELNKKYFDNHFENIYKNSC